MEFYNKCSENSRSPIVFRTDIFRKLTLGVPDNRLLFVSLGCFNGICFRQFSCDSVDISLRFLGDFLIVEHGFHQGRWVFNKV